VELTLLPKIKIEIVCEDEDLKPIVATITENAKTGEIGDGKIFVYSIEDIVRIRTGESGKSAV
jgi:nitrogen regulatory protein P-II 1